MVKKFTYTVRGSWPFPTDMLRYDDSKAATPEDQAMIDRLSSENAPDLESLQNRVSITLIGNFKPNTARWESFLWTVPDDFEYRWLKEAQKEKSEREILKKSALAKLTPEEKAALEWYAGKKL